MRRALVFLGIGILVLVFEVGGFVVGCNALPLVQFLNSSFPETVVENTSDASLIAETDDTSSTGHDTFVTVRPHSITVIDSQGEGNAYADHVWLWDGACTQRTAVIGNFSEGGTLTVGVDGTVSYVRGRTDRLSPTELDIGHSSCEAAAGLR